MSEAAKPTHFWDQIPIFFKSPLVDPFARMTGHPTGHKCNKFEIEMLECLEAYGYDLGQSKCKDIIDDFNECVYMKKQLLRMEALQRERARQYRAGKIDDKWAEPPRKDAY